MAWPSMPLVVRVYLQDGSAHVIIASGLQKCLDPVRSCAALESVHKRPSGSENSTDVSRPGHSLSWEGWRLIGAS